MKHILYIYTYLKCIISHKQETNSICNSFFTVSLNILKENIIRLNIIMLKMYNLSIKRVYNLKVYFSEKKQRVEWYQNKKNERLWNLEVWDEWQRRRVVTEPPWLAVRSATALLLKRVPWSVVFKTRDTIEGWVLFILRLLLCMQQTQVTVCRTTNNPNDNFIWLFFPPILSVIAEFPHSLCCLIGSSKSWLLPRRWTF